MAGTATHQIAVLAVMAHPFAGPATIDELDARLPIGRKQIATAAAKLIQRSFVERLETGVYALTATGRKALEDGAALTSGPHRGRRKHPAFADTLQQRAWNAMRLAGRFTIGDIATLAGRPEDKGVEGTLQRLFHRLARAGYLTELPKRVRGTEPGSNGFKQWRLTRDTGARAPQFLERQQAFKDVNTREVFPCR